MPFTTSHTRCNTGRPSQQSHVVQRTPRDPEARDVVAPKLVGAGAGKARGGGVVDAAAKRVSFRAATLPCRVRDGEPASSRHGAIPCPPRDSTRCGHYDGWIWSGHRPLFCRRRVFSPPPLPAPHRSPPLTWSMAMASWRTTHACPNLAGPLVPEGRGENGRVNSIIASTLAEAVGGFLSARRSRAPSTAFGRGRRSPGAMNQPVGCSCPFVADARLPSPAPGVPCSDVPPAL